MKKKNCVCFFAYVLLIVLLLVGCINPPPKPPPPTATSTSFPFDFAPMTPLPTPTLTPVPTPTATPTPLPTPTPELTPTPKYTEATRSMLALNYCLLSLTKILAYEDRVILDQEYQNIINNIRLSEIHDEEIVSILTGLMDTITAFRIKEGDQSLFQKQYDQHVSKAFYHTVQESLTKVADAFPWQLLSRTLIAVGGFYWNYCDQLESYRNEIDSRLWQLEKSDLEKINDVQKTFLTAFWKLMEKYHIPDEWRLTQQQLQSFIAILREKDAEKRWRQLDALKQGFAMFPPFWYALAQTAYQLNKTEDALKLYRQIEVERFPFFREDYEYAAAVMNKILLIQAVEKTQPDLLAKTGIKPDIYKDLETLATNNVFDWQKNLFVALQYMRIRNYAAAEALIIRNLDNRKDVSMNSRILGEMYALSDQQKLVDLISQMARNPNVRFFDAIYLLGLIREPPNLEKASVNTLKPAMLTVQYIKYVFLGKDTLIISLPDIWLQGAADSFTVLARWLDNGKIFPQERVKFNPQNKHWEFNFTSELSKKELIAQRLARVLLVTLSDGVQNVTLGLNVNVVSPSKDADPELEFKIKEIKTVNACYRLQDGALKALAACSF